MNNKRKMKKKKKRKVLSVMQCGILWVPPE
jgi:hypothetical protein